MIQSKTILSYVTSCIFERSGVNICKQLRGNIFKRLPFSANAVFFSNTSTMAALLPPRRNPTPTKISKQHLTPLQTLLQMGFPKHRVEKALAATGHRGVQLASDWLLAHVNDPLLDDNSPREYILYACPTGAFCQQLQAFWEKSLSLCGWNGAHNFTPHITLVSFFKAPDEDALTLSQGLKSVMERQGAVLNEPLKLETYTSPNFMGFFVAEEHADYLKRIAMQYVKEVSNAIISDTYEHFDALTACFPWCTTTTARCIPRGSRSISLEPHVKSLHLTLAYQFPNSQYSNLKALVDQLDPGASENWELRLYSRDPRINSKQINKVVHAYTPIESDELDLRIGDYVYVSSEAVASSPDGWVEGTSWLTGQSGLLPESYTERTAESDAWTLHKKIALNQLESSDEKRKNQKKDNMIEEPSALFSEVVKPPIPPKVNDGDYGDEGNLYENLLELKKMSTNDAEAKSRSVFIMRHGERIDFTFGTWTPYCFDESGQYTRRDLNMPKNLPYRSEGATGYLKDSPITNVGILQATLVGESFKENNIEIEYAYSSPSFRCIQTCDGFLRGLGKRDQIKIRIEPGLFEWTVWYNEGVPNWMTKEELIQGGYNIDETYKPFVEEKELKESKENCEQFHLRSAFITRSALSAHSTGNFLLVGHSATLDTCSHELVGNKSKSASDMIKLIQKIPYCGLVEITNDSGEWKIVEPPCQPITHSNNQRFDYKLFLE
ncbi:protein UBASH3A homolog isoform X1 [Diabrotica virgifera virgifera]|uniref:Protein UBASH3A homolog n=1 Tax=Diabrotica virgifera virgifera TaxID=50390 RepID=A0ABM5KJJ4_DIAVI|nr:protein UBASH3A homolog isoform X1 [Diabrotica virgifera virgifera]